MIRRVETGTLVALALGSAGERAAEVAEGLAVFSAEVVAVTGLAA